MASGESELEREEWGELEEQERGRVESGREEHGERRLRADGQEEGRVAETN